MYQQNQHILLQTKSIKYTKMLNTVNELQLKISYFE